MNSSEKYKDDLLRGYISPAGAENAPEGFTSNVMTRVRLESLPVVSKKRNLIPVIYGIFTCLLIATAVLFPGNNAESLFNPVIDIFSDIKDYLPVISLSSVLKVNLPSVIIYVFIGIIILTIFDRALRGMFRKS